MISLLPAEKLQNFFGVFLQFQIGVDNDHNNSRRMLLTESYPNHPDQVPEATEFLMELLVPGSTK